MPMAILSGAAKSSRFPLRDLRFPALSAQAG
jgi:hypothetical protein